MVYTNFLTNSQALFVIYSCSLQKQ